LKKVHAECAENAENIRITLSGLSVKLTDYQAALIFRDIL